VTPTHFRASRHPFRPNRTPKEADHDHLRPDDPCPTIAITGATGQLGRLVLHSLKTRAPGATVIALARTPPRPPTWA
jgi:hypothetical protein